ncbi:hypothetical protein GPUN_0529 [Glaciecola punicea ACAM 611]|uniref:Uncharacterized protein n=1 Tax=Glaciecola punicea ACAM 611 TaxID=1121923 RepID=H5T8P8_9ALTE|nr:hypothetical protein GPUN_0529 [Glaciecola punicea ACAM 611]
MYSSVYGLIASMLIDLAGVSSFVQWRFFNSTANAVVHCACAVNLF